VWMYSIYVHCVCVVIRRVYDMYSVYVREDIVDVQYVCTLCVCCHAQGI
jgi:hypothetical protein